MKRRLLAMAMIVAGAAAMTVSMFAMRAPASAPTFVEGRVEHDRAGHNPRELLVAGIGVALALAGGILLISRKDGS
jgi:hypothetical protein